MATALRMPQPGQLTEECTVLRWFKAVGDSIAKGDTLYEIETDKSNMDVEAFDTGTLLAIVIAEGETVPVDTVVAWIGSPGETIPEIEATPSSAGAEGEVRTEGTPPSPSTGPAGYPPSETEPSGSAIAPTAGAPDAPAFDTVEAEAGRRIAVSPRAARVAIELGIDPASVNGTGPGGRIVERDVRAASAQAPRAAVVVSAAAPRPATGSYPGEPERLSRLRRVIARRLSESATTIPSFSIEASVDMTGLVELRAELRAAESPISLTDFVHAATVGALVEHPLVNSVTDGEQLWRRESVHLGIAVAIEDGLLVPVIRDAQAMSLAELDERTGVLVAAAREGTLGPDELSGSTFTVSNMGMYGVDAFTAIINPGESGILAVSAIKPQVVAMDHGITTRQAMRLSLTADHRLVDGELGARFLNDVRSRLEDAMAFRDEVSTDAG